MVAVATVAPPTNALDGAMVQDFVARLRGPVLGPEDAGYDDARAVRNGLIDRRPALIVRCAGAADVVEAVNFARDNDLLLSVRGGGHNVAGSATNDGGLVIDLSAMRGVRVDPAARTVRVQGGATWGDVDRETQLFGLAVPGGVVSSTGVGGLTLGGGMGHLRCMHGLSIDSLLSADVITADGHVRTASPTENGDLFWAIRGGGGNFGVVTSFEFRAHPVGPLVQLCAPFYALADGESVLRAWRDFTARAPDEVNSVLLLWSGPDDEHFPPEIRRRPVVIPAAVYAGPVEDGERIMQPLREFATPLVDLSGAMPYAALQGAFDPFFPKGDLYYWKSTYVDDLSDAAIATMLRVAAERPSYRSSVTLWRLGGAIGRIGASETAYARRDAPYLVTAEATWTEPRENEPNIRWSRDALTAMQPYSKGGLYLNFPGFGEEKEALVRAAYGPNHDRLVAIKTAYDPTNLFRMNLNITPNGAA